MKQSKASQAAGTNRLTNNTVKTLFIIGLALALVTGYVLWRQVISSPKNVFNGMLAASLKTRSVAKRTTQSSGGQSLDQTTVLQANQYNTAQALTTLIQQGAGNGATVRTETRGTPRSDYVRYTEITTEQTDADGNQLDFGNVIGVWGRSGGLAGQNGELYGESVLGIVPIGYVNQNQHAELMDFIKDNNVYEVDYAQVERQNIDGRPQYVYPVQIAPEAYVELLRRFAEAVGLNHLDQLDPAQFRDSPKLRMRLTVDVWSRQLVEVRYMDSGRVEALSAYGSWVPLTLPAIEETITIDELQTRLQSVE